jgi:outer membrane autotransporter protein
VVFGADLLRTDKVLAGAAISWVGGSATGTDNFDGSVTRINGYQLTGYAAAAPSGFGGRLNFSGQFGYGYNTYDQTRQIDVLGAHALSSYGGQQIWGSAMAGYSFIGRNAAITPYVGLNEAHLVNRGYSETGAGVVDLQVQSSVYDTFGSEAGVNLDSLFDTAVGQLLPSFKLGWTHVFTNSPITIDSTLAGVAFSSASARIAADGAAIGAGLTLQRAGRWKIGVEYHGDIRQDFQSPYRGAETDDAVLETGTKGWPGRHLNNLLAQSRGRQAEVAEQAAVGIVFGDID